MLWTEDCVLLETGVFLSRNGGPFAHPTSYHSPGTEVSGVTPSIPFTWPWKSLFFFFLILTQGHAY